MVVQKRVKGYGKQVDQEPMSLGQNSYSNNSVSRMTKCFFL